jgi:hypothetical protein
MRRVPITLRTLFPALPALLAIALCGASAHAQAKPAAAGAPKASCTGEIPFGVKVARLPDAEQKKVGISDFSVSAREDAMTYDLAMRVKNGSATWCVTSLAIAYVFGDARGQEWTANEYPAVLQFTTHLPTPDDRPKDDKAKDAKAKPAPPHAVGMPPGHEEKRILFDVYFYIQPRPMGLFDGFHLISADIKSCMGYPLTKAP